MPAAANLATPSSYGVRSESLTRDDDRIATDGLAPPQDVLGDVRRHGVSTQPGVDHRQMSRDVDRVCVGAHLSTHRRRAAISPASASSNRPVQAFVTASVTLARKGAEHPVQGHPLPLGQAIQHLGLDVLQQVCHCRIGEHRLGFVSPRRKNAESKLLRPRHTGKPRSRLADSRLPGDHQGGRLDVGRGQAGHRSLGAPERLTVATGTPSSFQLANAFACAPAIYGSTSWRNSVASRRSCAAHLYECRTGSCHLGNRMSECVIRLTTMRYGFARRSTPSAASTHPRLAPQVAVVAFRTARRGSNLPLVGAVPHTVVTMVNGGRITDGGRYPS